MNPNSFSPLPFRGAPAAPNNAVAEVEVVEVSPLAETAAVRQISVFVHSVKSGNSPFIAPQTTIRATVARDFPVTQGSRYECRAEYIGDERGGKAYLSELRPVSPE